MNPLKGFETVERLTTAHAAAGGAVRDLWWQLPTRLDKYIYRNNILYIQSSSNYIAMQLYCIPIYNGNMEYINKCISNVCLHLPKVKFRVKAGVLVS